jgi:hypothetical protein
MAEKTTPSQQPRVKVLVQVFFCISSLKPEELQHHSQHQDHNRKMEQHRMHSAYSLQPKRDTDLIAENQEKNNKNIRRKKQVLCETFQGYLHRETIRG